MFLETEEFKEWKEDAKELIQTFKEHPFLIIFSAFTMYWIIVIVLLLFP